MKKLGLTGALIMVVIIVIGCFMIHKKAQNELLGVGGITPRAVNFEGKS
ncbi:hypothetical protein Xbud_03141 [Xenorhabdus budapestensis]|uniref:Uncharacterized protein n=1 Tax=Xenorhabdus budapestensis TaxID=290110 RepID=A0A2D0IT81_XENBU|nr:hypothetical protein Xbud_03141 [Xenorhabdus budapestensis]